MKFLYRPVKTLYIGQGFGANGLCVNSKGQYLPSNNGKCKVGYKPFYETLGMKGHNGLDISAADWQPIYCAYQGKVIQVETEEKRGLGVVVLSEFEGKFYKHLYWHFNGNNVKVGDVVKTGDVLGFAGSTGYSSGTHLHFELKPCDKKGNNLYQKNGYFGAVDPEPYMLNVFALDVDKLAKVKETLALILEMLTKLTGRR